jgi:hypothetical protein
MLTSGDSVGYVRAVMCRDVGGREGSTSRIKRLERGGGGPRLSAMKSRDCLTYLAAVLVVLQQGPCLREIRLQRPKFVIRVSSSTPRVMKIGATAVPAR